MFGGDLAALRARLISVSLATPCSPLQHAEHSAMCVSIVARSAGGRLPRPNASSCSGVGWAVCCGFMVRSLSGSSREMAAGALFFQSRLRLELRDRIVGHAARVPEETAREPRALRFCPPVLSGLPRQAA